MTKRKKMVVLIAFVLGLVALYGAKEWLFSPNINPNPTQRIVMHGSFPFDNGFSLQLQVSFTSNNPTCRQVERAFLIFAAANVDRTIRFKTKIVKTGNSQYETDIYLDYVAPGFCDWQYSGMSYNISGGPITHGLYSALGDIPKKTKMAIFQCSDRYIKNIGITSFYCLIEQETPQSELLAPAQIDFIWKDN